MERLRASADDLLAVLADW